MYKFGFCSEQRLTGVHPDLIRAVRRAMSLQVVDFTVLCGVRTLEQQKALYAQGRDEPGRIVTWTMNSLHMEQDDGYGHAIDLAPYPVLWSGKLLFAQLAGIVKVAAKLEKVDIECGIDWKHRDTPHYQIRR